MFAHIPKRDHNRFPTYLLQGSWSGLAGSSTAQPAPPQLLCSDPFPLVQHFQVQKFAVPRASSAVMGKKRHLNGHQTFAHLSNNPKTHCKLCARLHLQGRRGQRCCGAAFAFPLPLASVRAVCILQLIKKRGKAEAFAPYYGHTQLCCMPTG